MKITFLLLRTLMFLFCLCFTLWLALISLPSADSKDVHNKQKQTQEAGKKAVHHTHHKSGGISQHDKEQGRKGQKKVVNHVKEDNEKHGKKHQNHAVGQYKAHKSKGRKSAHDASFKDGAHHKKGNYRKGFREKYHKDEEKSSKDFYTSSHKSGNYKIYGKHGSRRELARYNKQKAGNLQKSVLKDKMQTRSTKSTKYRKVSVPSKHTAERRRSHSKQ